MCCIPCLPLSYLDAFSLSSVPSFFQHAWFRAVLLLPNALDYSATGKTVFTPVARKNDGDSSMTWDGPAL